MASGSILLQLLFKLQATRPCHHSHGSAREAAIVSSKNNSEISRLGVTTQQARGGRMLRAQIDYHQFCRRGQMQQRSGDACAGMPGARYGARNEGLID